MRGREEDGRKEDAIQLCFSLSYFLQCHAHARTLDPVLVSASRTVAHFFSTVLFVHQESTSMHPGISQYHDS